MTADDRIAPCLHDASHLPAGSGSSPAAGEADASSAAIYVLSGASTAILTACAAALVMGTTGKVQADAVTVALSAVLWGPFFVAAAAAGLVSLMTAVGGCIAKRRPSPLALVTLALNGAAMAGFVLYLVR